MNAHRKTRIAGIKNMMLFSKAQIKNSSIRFTYININMHGNKIGEYISNNSLISLFNHFQNDKSITFFSHILFPWICILIACN